MSRAPSPSTQVERDVPMTTQQPEPVEVIVNKDGQVRLLPPELWLQVFENLDGHNLSSIALVNSAYQQLVLPILYRDLALYGAGMFDVERFPNKTMSGIQKLLHSPQLAQVVRTCHISRWAFSPPELGQLLELLLTLPNLHTLQLTRTYVGHAICNVISLMKPLRVLFIKSCHIELSESCPAPPNLRSLTISEHGTRGHPNAIASFAHSPQVQTFSLTSLYHQDDILGHLQNSTLAITDLRLCVLTEAHALSASTFLTHSCPNLKTLRLLPGHPSLAIPPEAIPCLKSFEGEFSTVPNIVPGRPVSELDLMLNSGNDAMFVQRAFDSLILSKEPIRKLKLRLKYIDANTIDFFAEHFVDLEELAVFGVSRSHFKILFSNTTCASLTKLTRLRILNLECFSDGNASEIAVEKGVLDQIHEAMPQLCKVNFTKFNLWTKKEGAWTSSILL